MNNLAAQLLAIIAFIVLAMALSATSTGAKVVQAGLFVIILAVLLRNSTAIQNATKNVSGLVTQPLAQSPSTGGN